MKRFLQNLLFAAGVGAGALYNLLVAAAHRFMAVTLTFAFIGFSFVSFMVYSYFF